jgi:glutathione S-transferase
VSEKVRVVLGIKDLRWGSVEIPHVPPKPNLMVLTGGYRRTPVMQVGADIYCDSQCIIRELERRFREPTLFPGGTDGMAWGLSRWTDTALFDTAVAVVLGAQVADLPPDFAADRGRLYFGPSFDLTTFAADLPHLLAQLRGQLKWADERIGAGRRFMLGDDPGLPDALVYYLVWFLRRRYTGGTQLLNEFEALAHWEERVQALGHGEAHDLDAATALDMARDAEPQCATKADPLDPQGLAPGMDVEITPDLDGGDPAVAGEVLAVDAETIAIRRSDPRVGDLAVHFPRIGYRVSVL